MRNSVELRRFSSPHPSLFSKFLGSNDKRMAAKTYIGAEGPCRPWGGRQAPLHFFFARDLVANLKKKNYIRVLSPVAWATGPLSPLGRATEGF